MRILIFTVLTLAASMSSAATLNWDDKERVEVMGTTLASFAVAETKKTLLQIRGRTTYCYVSAEVAKEIGYTPGELQILLNSKDKGTSVDVTCHRERASQHASSVIVMTTTNAEYFKNR